MGVTAAVAGPVNAHQHQIQLLQDIQICGAHFQPAASDCSMVMVDLKGSVQCKGPINGNVQQCEVRKVVEQRACRSSSTCWR